MADESAVQQFISITGAPRDQAERLLDDNAGDLQDALSAFFENPQAGKAQQSSQAPAPSATPGASAPPANSAGRGGGRGPNIRGFGDLASAGPQPGKDDDDEGPDYFAGGERSGIVMKGQGKKDQSKGLVKDILDMAAKGGRGDHGHDHDHDGDEDEDMDEDEEGSGFRVGNRPMPTVNAFAGAGYRLGSEEDAPSSSSANTPTAPPQTRSATGAAVPPASRQKVTRTLTFWRDGFSVEDGELHRYDDPQSQELLEHIKSGRAPPSLLNVAIGQPVEVGVSHRLNEDYKPPPKVVKPFGGQGHTLGSIIPNPEPESGPSVPGAFPGAAGPSTGGPSGAPRTGAAATPGAAPALQVDANLPTTSIQIRLADGTRLVAKFNHTHTIGDVRRFIRASRPGESRPWAVFTTFPMKELVEDAASLKDAGLLNAVVVQKYK